MNSQFVYTRQSDSPLVFQPEAMGTVIRINVGKWKGRICFPRLSPEAVYGDFREVLAPVNFDAGVLPNIYGQRGPIDWGTQAELPSGMTRIEAWLIEFDLAQVISKVRNQMTEVARQFDPWFGIARDWLELLALQDLSVDEPINHNEFWGNYVWSWKARTRWRATTAASSGLVLMMANTSNAITLQEWRRALFNASQGTIPPAAHLLLRDSRRRLNRRAYKYSVIIAGIAAEVVIKEHVEQILRNGNTPQSFIDRVLRGTLGSLVSIATSLGISLPNNITIDLIDVRNRAIHRNADITRDQANLALNLASQIVMDFAPV